MIDVVPTVPDIAGVTPAMEVDGTAVPPPQGRSFLASLADSAAPPAHDALWWCHDGHRAVRVGDGKLVATKPGPVELYDLAADPSETTNVVDGHPAVAERLRAILDREHLPHPDWPLPFADQLALLYPVARSPAADGQPATP